MSINHYVKIDNLTDTYYSAEEIAEKAGLYEISDLPSTKPATLFVKFHLNDEPIIYQDNGLYENTIKRVYVDWDDILDFLEKIYVAVVIKTNNDKTKTFIEYTDLIGSIEVYNLKMLHDFIDEVLQHCIEFKEVA